jgi:hypothetical protein
LAINREVAAIKVHLQKLAKEAFQKPPDAGQAVASGNPVAWRKAAMEAVLRVLTVRLVNERMGFHSAIDPKGDDSHGDG